VDVALCSSKAGEQGASETSAGDESCTPRERNTNYLYRPLLHQPFLRMTFWVHACACSRSGFICLFFNISTTASIRCLSLSSSGLILFSDAISIFLELSSSRVTRLVLLCLTKSPCSSIPHDAFSCFRDELAQRACIRRGSLRLCAAPAFSEPGGARASTKPQEARQALQNLGRHAFHGVWYKLVALNLTS